MATTKEILDGIKLSHYFEVLCEERLKGLFRSAPGFEKGNIEVIQLENKNDKLCKYFDMKCGIDYQVSCRLHSVSLAWRATRCRKSMYPDGGVYNAFSIPEKTDVPGSEEYCALKKLKDAIKYGYTRPNFMAQVYYDMTDYNRIVSLALAKIDDIIATEDQGYWRLANCVNDKKKIWMHDVSWSIMKKLGYTVYDWYADDSCKPTCFLDFPPVEYHRVI